MQINNNSSLFKATRRTMVAEMTLMIVIVISFSWSAYALYKLFAGGSESLFGYTFANGSPQAAQESRLVNTSRSFSTQPVIDQQHDSYVNSFNQRQDLERQLANYKSQILNELMARQQRLIEGDTRAASGQDLMSMSLAPSYSNHRKDGPGITDRRRPVNVVDELQRWKGGYKLPTSLDYLFENNNRRPAAARQAVNSYSESLEQADRMPLSSINSHAAVAMKSNSKQPLQHSLVHLTNAPSLMQLNPRALSTLNEETGVQQQATTTTTPAPNLISIDPIEDDRLISTTTTTSPPPLETTTIEPPNQADESENETTPAPNNDQDEENNDDQQSSGDSGDKSTEPDQDDRASRESMERVRNTSRSIDEDVDRMTQPSLGMASREDKPTSDYKGTVQFDDGPSSRPSSIKDILAKELSAFPNKRATDGLGSSGRAASIKSKISVDDNMSQQWPAGDLLVADDRHKTPISATYNHMETRPKRFKSQPNSRGANADRETSSERRTKKSPLGRDSESAKRKLKDYEETRALLQRSRRSTPFDNIELNRPAGKRRRSDDDDDDENSDENEDENSSENNSETENEQKINSKDSTDVGPTLQELLAHKKLLDALQQSQLPAPVAVKQPQVNGTSLSSNAMIKPNDQGDHQPAGTQYSVDHGLLLYPASDEEHEHKSTSHKSGKSSKKKGKKKVTLAMKKGGHKNKKHKKEEKKYVKEKKFKGAKKGKKMSKGKGGKGGKKGKKFYKDKGFKKKGFKNIYVKNEFGQKKSYFDEFRDKDFKKKWKNYDDKYNYAQMKKWQAKDVKGAKKMKDHGEDHKKYDKGKWKKNYHKHMESEMAKKKKKQSDDF